MEQLKDCNISSSLIDSLNKMVIKPFYETQGSNYRLFKGSLNNLTNYITNKDSSQFYPLSSIGTDKYDFILKKNYKTSNIDYYKAPKLLQGKSSLVLLGGKVWMINDINETTETAENLATINYLMNNASKLEPEDEYTVYNEYVDFIHNIIPQEERENLKQKIEKSNSHLYELLKQKKHLLTGSSLMRNFVKEKLGSHTFLPLSSDLVN